MFSAPGLGDGVLTMVLLRNLQARGLAATLRNDSLHTLAPWFPGADLEPLPTTRAEQHAALEGAWGAWFGNRAVRPDAASDLVDPKRTVLFDKTRCDRRRGFLWNARRLTEAPFALEWTTDRPGIATPETPFRQHARRIVLQPFSARPQKDWPLAHWNALAQRLAARGLVPVFAMAPEQTARFHAEGGAGDVHARPLAELPAFLHASGAVVAPDSGVAHLAAALDVPTVVLFRKRSSAAMWRPPWGPTRVVLPPVRLPGAAGARLWTRLLRPGRVAAALGRLLEASEPTR